MDHSNPGTPEAPGTQPQPQPEHVRPRSPGTPGTPGTPEATRASRTASGSQQPQQATTGQDRPIKAHASHKATTNKQSQEKPH